MLFIKHIVDANISILIVYVDDIVIIGDNNETILRKTH